ncbi:MAG: hypothetical protein ACRYG8_35845 [Janthinobacterium lividum]
MNLPALIINQLIRATNRLMQNEKLLAENISGPVADLSVLFFALCWGSAP